MEREPLHKIRQWRDEGLTLVFTNGCFDLLHPGHVTSLQEASTYGDRLIVGLNVDATVTSIKGEGRPIFSLSERSTMLNSLAFVDLVIPFEEETPIELIKEIQPDVLAKGGDYNEGNIVGAKFVRSTGGLVKILNFVEGYSSSDIVEKIKEIKTC